MAVTTPILEREVKLTDNGIQQKSTNSTQATYEELHNARIRDNYARLINPNFKIEDLFAEPSVEEVKAPEKAAVVTEQVAQPAAKPYLVENARADAAIFRADSAVNRKVSNVAPAATTQSEEEENEDLRPTGTTIQYQTIKNSGKVTVQDNKSESKDFVFGKREKIIVAVFISVVVALFALVIINSAIIANLNNDISAIQNSLTTVRGALAGVNGEIATLTSPENIAQFAEQHNLVLK
jgi:cell division protein FtsL